jgi:cyanophycinase
MRTTGNQFALLVAGMVVGLAGTCGAADPATAPSVGGALVICGGGKLPDEIYERFVELAGGPEKARLVVVTTANDLAGRPQQQKFADFWKARKVSQVTLMHTSSRDEANKPEFVEPLRKATAVWFEGGQQSRVAAAYLDTAVERELYALVKRGGVVGGTSAGAALQSRVMIRSGNPVAEVGRGFDLLPGAVVDQHFLKRNRVNRLLGVVEAHSDLVGYGIDEGTAMIVRGDRFRVLGASYVLACRYDAQRRRTHIEVLSPGQERTLSTR